MEIINVLKPNDFTYPLSKERFEDGTIIYHGTSSSFSEEIESKGWIPFNHPYIVTDLEFIYDSFYSLRYETVDSAGIFPYIKDENKRLPSFTKIYWAARNYSRNLGGEITLHILRAIEEFEAFVKSKTDIQEHKEFLKGLSHLFYGSIDSTLEFLENEEYLEQKLAEMMKIKKKYDHITLSNSFPVVYVLKACPEDFPDWTNLPFWEDRENRTLFKTQQGLELRSGKSIPPEQIITKINFPNGIQEWDPNMNDPLPLPWKNDSFLTNKTQD